VDVLVDTSKLTYDLGLYLNIVMLCYVFLYINKVAFSNSKKALELEM